MKPQKWNVPRGEIKNIAAAVGVSITNVGKVLNGKIEGVCSEDTARRIYQEAKLHQATRLK